MDPDYITYFDGGCTSNPGGKLAVGAVVCTPNGEVIVEQARAAGEGTSNIAEYRALSHAICLANLVGSRRPLFVSDSMLVVQQINGLWAMRGDSMSPLHRAHSCCYSALMKFDRWVLRHVPRERNRRADWLVSTFLEQGRALKKPPAVVTIGCEDTEGRPGWSELSPSRSARAPATVS